MSQRLRDPALVLGISAIVFLGNLGSARLWDEDEPRNARCAVEMMQRGDLIVPTFNGELRTHKPILLYWLMLTSYQVFGVSEFSARLPSALCGMGTMFCVWLCGRRLLGRQAGLLAAIALSTALMFDVAARAATPDSALILCMTAAMTIYVRATIREPASARDAASSQQATLRNRSWFPQSWRAFVGFYACLGFAMLAKGPVGFVLPMAVIGMFLLIVRRADEDSRNVGQAAGAAAPRWAALRTVASWFSPMHFWRTLRGMRPMAGTAIAVAIAGPWYFAVGHATDGEWLRGFFLEHNLGRAAHAMEHHSGPFVLYYLAVAMIGFFPWSVMIGPALIDARRRLRRDAEFLTAMTFAICWFAVPVVLFSFSSTKLPSYITPGYPGLALLVGGFLDRALTGTADVGLGWLKASVASSLVVGVALTAGAIVAIQRVFPGDYPLLAPGIALTLVAAFSLLRLFQQQTRQALWSYAGGAAILAVSGFAIAAPQVARHQQIADLCAAADVENADVAAFEVFQSSWVFYANQTVERYGSRSLDEMMSFLRADPSHFVIAQTSRVRELPEDVRSSLRPVCEVPWFLKGHDEQLVLLIGFPRDVAAETSPTSARPVRISSSQQPDMNTR